MPLILPGLSISMSKGNESVAPAVREKRKWTSGSGAVLTATRMLRLLALGPCPMGVNAIARELSIAPSSCFRIVKTLVGEEFVAFDADAKTYSLGSGAVELARRALDPSRAFATVRPRLEGVAQAHSIAIGLWRVLPKARMMLVGLAEGERHMRVHMAIGQRVPIFVGALGRAIMAQMNLPRDELKQSFETLRWKRPLAFPEYLRQVEQARRTGYGLDEGHFAPGVSTVAATIADASGAVRFGLSGIMFNGQHDRRAMDRIGSEISGLAKWAAVRLVR